MQDKTINVSDLINHNITELELAFDSTFNYILKVRKMIKDTDAYDL